MPEAMRQFRSPASLSLLLVALTMLSACASVPAEYQSSRLALERGFFSGYKYTFDGSEPEGVYNFWGLYNGAFLDLLSQQPAALEEAESATPLLFAKAGITTVLSIYAIFEATAATRGSTSIYDSNDSDAHLTNAIGALIGSVVAGAVLGIPIQNRLYNSVGMFNAGLAPPPADRSNRGLLSVMPNTLRLNPATRQIDLGWKLRR